MVKIKIEDLKEGMVVGESVFDDSHKLLIAAGFRLEAKHIPVLKKKGIKSIFINVDGIENVEAKSTISDHVKNELTNILYKSSTEIGEILKKSKKNKEAVKEIIKKDKHHINKIIRNSGALRVINKAIGDILNEPWTVISLEKMIERDNELYSHILNVMMISLCIGHKFHFTLEELIELGLSVINYDIGMLAVPKEIMNKDPELTVKEKDVLMQHTLYGYMMLSDIPGIPVVSPSIALWHHEYQDGSGYPQGLRGENRPPLKSMSKRGLINRFAEIVTVADTYDMFTNGRKHFSPEMKTEKAIQKMIEMGRTKLNIEILKMLLSILPIYPIGTRIRVIGSPRSELMGCYGVIAQVRPDIIFEPIVVLIESKLKKRLPKTVMLDFAKHKGFIIELAE